MNNPAVEIRWCHCFHSQSLCWAVGFSAAQDAGKPASLPKIHHAFGAQDTHVKRLCCKSGDCPGRGPWSDAVKEELMEPLTPLCAGFNDGP